MRVIGFNFTKINVEKKDNPSNNLKINTKIDISEINDFESETIQSKESLLKVKFIYEVNYEPNFAKIQLEGVFIITLDAKKSKEMLKQWKDKKISDTDKLDLFNIILRKASLKALELEDEMNLPLHISLPVFRKQENTKD